MNITKRLLILILLITVWGCQPLPEQNAPAHSGTNESQTETTPESVASENTPPVDQAPAESAPTIEVFFSQVDDGPEAAAANPNNIDKKLVEKLDLAKTSIDAALHEIDSERIAEALMRAKERGVMVSVVTETDYMDEFSIEQLQEAGIPIVNDNGRSGLMHNKFIIIDGEFVWTGSLNTTDNGANKNNNNGVFIHSPELAENFAAEFEEMFNNQSFGKRSPKEIPHPVVQLPDGTELLVRFSPENEVDQLIIDEIGTAHTQIRFMAFSFTHDGIGDALLQKAAEGVEVKGIFEKRGSTTRYSELPRLLEAGLDVRQDGNPYVLHHKVIVIDDQTTILGSFNFSQNATKTNDENLLVIRHNKAVADQFLQEFERLYAIAAVPAS